MSRAALFCAVVSVSLAGLCATAIGDRNISADVYLDKARGMWVGQILGNYAGRGVVPGTSSQREGYIVRGGADFDVGWSSFLSTPTWVADDDTSLEYMYLDLLKGQATPSSGEIGAVWMDNISAGSLYIANKQARWLMEPPPVGASLSPPQTGSIYKNIHWYAIDAQITTESIGALSPGMRQNAADLSARFANVTNDGYPVHAAQYYAAMYAAAAFDGELAGANLTEKLENLVSNALEVVPASSRTHEVIQAVRAQYDADKVAGNLDDPDAWREAQRILYDNYGTSAGSNYRYRYWIESTVNVGLTTMAVLYGQGDFKKTVEIGVLGGYDADCNPATAGGLIGMIKGYDGPGGSGGILAELPATPSDSYSVTSLMSIGTVTTISQVAEDFRTAAEAQILAAGGSVSGEGPNRTYTIPDDNVLPPVERPDPSSPAGLVGQVLAAGGGVTASASLEMHNPNNDRQNLDAIIDGISDVSYNGHLPYLTDDGENDQPPGGDWYRLEFGRKVAFEKVIFYEGDILWSGINNNPRNDEHTPRGGYFTNLTVEVRNGESFTEVSNLLMSEELDPFEYFQTIELTFDRITGDAIQIRGDAGGTYQFTSIVELETYGLGPGDLNGDGLVNAQDINPFVLALTNLPAWQALYPAVDILAVGDMGGPGGIPDGLLNAQDINPFVYILTHLPPGDIPIPEPASLSLLVGGAMVMMKRKSKRCRIRGRRNRA